MLVNKLEYYNTADTISSAAPGHVAPASPGLGLGLFYMTGLHWRIQGALPQTEGKCFSIWTIYNNLLSVKCKKTVHR